MGIGDRPVVATTKKDLSGMVLLCPGHGRAGMFDREQRPGEEALWRCRTCQTTVTAEFAIQLIKMEEALRQGERRAEQAEIERRELDRVRGDAEAWAALVDAIRAVIDAATTNRVR